MGLVCAGMHSSVLFPHMNVVDCIVSSLTPMIVEVLPHLASGPLQAARGHNTVISVLTVAGEDCDLDLIGTCADLTAGTVDTVDPAALQYVRRFHPIFVPMQHAPSHFCLNASGIIPLLTQSI